MATGTRSVPLRIRYKKEVQESIPVGCVPPACQPYMFWWPPLGVSSGGYPLIGPMSGEGG